MFDRHYYRAGDTHSRTVVNQQPNDAADAARLYGEVEQKAEQKIKEVVGGQLTGTRVEFATVDMHRSPMHFKDDFHVVFKINGETIKSKVEVHDDHTVEDKLRSVIRKVAEGITNSIMDRVYMDMVRYGRGSFMLG